ncbi:Hli03 high light inducible protein [Synechococcus phage metaG-MbCM1]|uniref:Hli03 high light inducible protein n=1 Tax=Synechococcus phage metaG-MbCM1 TaxID=1079999 RepID=H8ZNJ7_9CAUD|nr:high light inducible protein [Synechococcus phage metaG-MbCM1]AFD03058.1 Hli03 high light inducible protein [Synechococcus phage metaG-MbCM1]
MKVFVKEKSVNYLFEKNSRVEPQKIWAETWNGRAAMVGLFAAGISDALTGHMFFGMF